MDTIEVEAYNKKYAKKRFESAFPRMKIKKIITISRANKDYAGMYRVYCVNNINLNM